MGVIKKGIIRIVLLLLIGAVVGIVLLSSDWLFGIQNIEFVGADTIPQQELRQLTGIETNQHLLKLDTKKVKDNLEKSPYIKVLSIEAKWFHTVTITIHERKTVAIIRNNDSDFLIDEEGFVLEEKKNNEVMPFPSVTGLVISQIKPGTTMETKETSYRQMTLDVILNIYRYKLQDVVLNIEMGKVIYLNTRMDVKVKVGQATHLEEKMQWAADILLDIYNRKEKGGVVDVSVVEKPIYQPPQITPSPTPLSE